MEILKHIQNLCCALLCAWEFSFMFCLYFVFFVVEYIYKIFDLLLLILFWWILILTNIDTKRHMNKMASVIQHKFYTQMTMMIFMYFYSSFLNFSNICNFYNGVLGSEEVKELEVGWSCLFVLAMGENIYGISHRICQ